ncbi:N-alpha-acetyltransferase 60 [Anthonomus grandis grandis]|uniref:N-alpha-acetyltransferase 60 n=1 Tax=Anthonomus grandis grandis TaxID=2921223 RepID=UPI002165DA98|nr:N-alpha-acetyltransferase 60 [Anthonomus grandis grandis]XP_050292737.1 N-alpha-acetyltransferase 60 [Anthonomus grandis grandis]
MADINWYSSKSGGDHLDPTMSAKRVALCSLADVQLRFLCPEDLDEVRALCQEWFPIEYPFYWYEEITSSNSRFYSLAAVYKKQIIGLIVAEIKPHSCLHKEDMGILAKSFSDCDIAYILSLGVLKEYRRNGIATLLLDSLLKNLTTPERKKVKAVFLHVLTTNSAAILFYQSNKFRLHTFLPYYYSIKGKCKDGFMYVLYINDGQPPWSLYDYIKFMCGRVIKGAGFFPWVLFNVNKALGWFWGSQQESDPSQRH